MIKLSERELAFLKILGKVGIIVNPDPAQEKLGANLELTRLARVTARRIRIKAQGLVELQQRGALAKIA